MTPTRYEVRGVYNSDAKRDYTRSYPIELLAQARTEEGRDPDAWGVYSAYGGGWVADHLERAAAERNVEQLNGEQQ